MYGAAIPIGLLVDTQGVKPGVFMGSVFLGVGYFFQYQGTNDPGLPRPKSSLQSGSRLHPGALAMPFCAYDWRWRMFLFRQRHQDL